MSNKENVVESITDPEAPIWDISKLQSFAEVTLTISK